MGHMGSREFWVILSDPPPSLPFIRCDVIIFWIIRNARLRGLYECAALGHFGLFRHFCQNSQMKQNLRSKFGEVSFRLFGPLLI